LDKNSSHFDFLKAHEEAEKSKKSVRTALERFKKVRVVNAASFDRWSEYVDNGILAQSDRSEPSDNYVWLAYRKKTEDRDEVPFEVVPLALVEFT
jgi:hypothetical protein